ncbi:MAG: chemotaxis protein CheW [Opitutales bacterium]|nr:chemotaxis protein CheW [Opitutales bacterium]
MAERDGNSRCWNESGIWGDASCPKLGEAIHCANCQIYADAGREFFEREIPKGYFKSWIDSSYNPSAKVSGGGAAYFVFKCGGALFALPPSAVAELSTFRMIHKIPFRRGGAVVGLVNIDGELVVAADLRRLFPNIGESDKPRCIVVCSSEQGKFAFAADYARGAAEPDEGTLAPAESGDGVCASGSFKLAGERVVVIDFEMLSSAVMRRAR